MKGVILAGGKGTRLGKLTSVLNKHLVAVGEVPMIEYPLSTIKKMGIKDIIVVTGAEHAGIMMEYLTIEHPEIDFAYKVQKEAGGIAQALGLVENVVGDSKLAVILGDNIFEGNFNTGKSMFEKHNEGARLFLKKVHDPERFGVAEIDEHMEKIISIEEKPSLPKSDLAVTGLYFYDNTIFDKIKKLKPSARGELELTDVNKMYLEEENLYYHSLEGFWSDAGTHKSKEIAEKYIRENKDKFIS